MSLPFAEFDLDPERRQLLRSGRPVSLERKAFELLSLLVERGPRALSRATLEDLGSKNGTRLNGEPVRVPQELHDGDSVRLGEVQLLFRSLPFDRSTSTHP